MTGFWGYSLPDNDNVEYPKNSRPNLHFFPEKLLRIYLHMKGNISKNSFPFNSRLFMKECMFQLQKKEKEANKIYPETLRIWESLHMQSK